MGLFGYYLELAVRSLKTNTALTVLMVAAVGVGVGASMTMLTTLRAMSGNPIPDKSSRLFVPQIDVWGPPGSRQSESDDQLPDQLTYRDAMALMRAHRGVRQTAMYSIGMDIDLGSGRPIKASGRAAYADFFSLFEVPFRAGASWSARDDEDRANVVVLGAKLADRVFPRSDAVGKTLNLDGREYRVVGVLEPWNPMPRFYDVTSGGFSASEDFFLPLTNTIDRQLNTVGNVMCGMPPPAGWNGLLASDCVWLQFWVELPTAASVHDYRAFLYNYAAEQRSAGRFHWPPRTGLYDMSDWMVQQRVVPAQTRVNTLVGLGFLVVCLINAVALMLAKFGSRTAELSVRRALGGSGTDIFFQCVMETAVIGLAGGILGTGMTLLGLTIYRALLAPGAKTMQLDILTRIDGGMLAIILAVAVASTVSVGLFPAWRASRLQPAWQLKVR